jgi:FKBP-type peptidyl-prolyl cis-trans isomerase FkpA
LNDMKKLGWFLLFVAIAVACKETVVTLTVDEQFAYDVNDIDEYLAEKNINAIKLENGIRYIISETGSGPMPTKDNCFRIKYRGSLLRETALFDGDSTDGYKAPLKTQIVGMQIMLKLMPVGSKGTVFIPSKLAYGSAGQPPIPRNANLKFDIELMQIYDFNSQGNYCYE